MASRTWSSNCLGRGGLDGEEVKSAIGRLYGDKGRLESVKQVVCLINSWAVGPYGAACVPLFSGDKSWQSWRAEGAYSHGAGGRLKVKTRPRLQEGTYG